jgi:hypothetical protein
MSAEFGKFIPNDGQSWSPDYGDIDWRLLESRLIESEDLEAVEPVGFDSGDGLVVECTQEVLVFRTNDVAPAMDMIAQRDERDGCDYIWFREDNPDRFSGLLESLGQAALKMHSRYPLPDTVDIYLDRRSTGISPEYLEQP